MTMSGYKTLPEKNMQLCMNGLPIDFNAFGFNRDIKNLDILWNDRALERSFIPFEMIFF